MLIFSLDVCGCWGRASQMTDAPRDVYATRCSSMSQRACWIARRQRRELAAMHACHVHSSSSSSCVKKNNDGFLKMTPHNTQKCSRYVSPQMIFISFLREKITGWCFFFPFIFSTLPEAPLQSITKMKGNNVFFYKMDPSC